MPAGSRSTSKKQATSTLSYAQAKAKLETEKELARSISLDALDIVANRSAMNPDAKTEALADQRAEQAYAEEEQVDRIIGQASDART